MKKSIPERIEILSYISSGEFTSKEVIDGLTDHESLRAGIKARFEAMRRDSQIKILSSGIVKVNLEDQRVGRVLITSKGYGFLQLENENDWFISKEEAQRCFTGELVIAMPKRKDEKGTTARIVGKKSLLRNVAVLVKNESFSSVSMDGIHFVKTKLTDSQGEEVDFPSGSWVKGDFVKAPSGPRGYTFKVLEIVDNISPIDEIRFKEMQPRGFSFEHPLEIENDAIYSCAETPNAKMDMRDVPFVSIDGKYSCDLDDLIYVKKQPDGKFNLIVAIADVSRYILHGSSLDKDAMERGTSLYTPGKSFSMLPKILANETCSLLPGMERNALVVDVILGENGEIEKYRFMEALVKSSFRFTYERVQELSEGAKPDKIESPHLSMLKDAYELSSLRKEIGARNGEMIITSEEACAKFNETGDVSGFLYEKQHESNNVIKELMIISNVSAALFLKRNAEPSLFRHHPGLQEVGLENLNSFLKELNIPELTEDSNRVVCSYIESVIPEDRKKEFFTLFRKAMTNARSHSKQSSHFGMGLSHYAHFTSPIRRYSDIIVHRSIKSILKRNGQNVYGAHSYTHEELKDVATHLTEKSYQASTIERNILDKLVCRWWELNPSDTISGIVTSTNSSNVYIRLGNTPIDGRIKLSKFEEQTGRKPACGESVLVSIEENDKDLGQISVTIKSLKKEK